MPSQKSPTVNELRSERTRVRRKPSRGTYDFETVARILDEGLYCHIGFSVDDQPYVVPTGYGREQRMLYIHGSSASRMLRTLAQGPRLCFTVTLVDGLVLARSGMHHSMNYRSVVVLGTAEMVADADKEHALRVITEHIVPGRWDEIRPPTPQELKATTVLQLPIEEASAKIRQGPPVDDEADYALPCWAGELPLALTPQPPIPDADLPADVALPSYLATYRRPQATGA